MITPSFSLTATERVLPKLALDFTTASLDSRVTFTRTTGASNPATYVNSSGYINDAANDQPRFDYDPVALTCKGLLIEESRTNLAKSSGVLSDVTYWALSAATTSANATTAPTNTNVATKVIEDTATSEHRIQQTFSSTAQSYVFSCYLKAAERTWATVQFYDGYSAINRGYSFDLANGQVGTMIGSSGVSATIENAGNGWWRCSIIRTMAGTSAGSRIQIGTATNTSTRSYTGDGTSGIYAWGAQLEAGAFATSYIPTTSTALTRNADVATMTGTNFSDWYNQSEGAMVCRWNEIKPGVNNNTTAALSFTDATNGSTAGDKLAIYTFTTGVRYQQTRVAGTVTSNITSGSAVAANVFATTAFAYKVDNYGISTGGATAGQDSSGAMPTSIDRAYIGRLDGGTNYLNGIVAKIYYYPQRLTNSQLQAFSKG